MLQRLQVSLHFFGSFFFFAHLGDRRTHLLVAHMSTHGGEGVGEDAAGAAGPDDLAASTQFSIHKAASNLSRRKLLQFSFWRASRAGCWCRRKWRSTLRSTCQQ